MHTTPVLLCLLLLATFSTRSTFAAGPKPGPEAYVTVETQDMKVEFACDRAWTISTIVYRGKVITGRPGFYGTVAALEGARWIGTGHNEGGVEKVESAVLTVDGKPCELTDKAAYQGRRAVLKKHSMIGSIRLVATYIVTENSVLEEHQYEMTQEIKVGRMYAFMHPFMPATTEWMAETIKGEIIEGRFDSKGGHQLDQDVRWTAIYDPTAGHVTLAWLPQPLPGPSPKTFYWDKTVYHKLYNQVWSGATVPAGTKAQARIIIRPAETDETSWKQRAKELVQEVQAYSEKGDSQWSE
ncbi:hypothetical protein WJU23_19635 [Prosthecobacter sp. SYSU 5D2]|uniref:hypothetical protein n=1 Tax=Prosthecobacter sp. SYSU 5D2 TaxID=3134134 RepID=UPI0031FE7915